MLQNDLALVRFLKLQNEGVSDLKDPSKSQLSVATTYLSQFLSPQFIAQSLTLDQM